MVNAIARLSVVISAFSWERKSDVEDTLAALEKQTSSNFDVVLVIDGDAALYEAMKAHLSQLRIVASCTFNPKDMGLSHSRNAGIRESSGEVIAFLDDDAVPATDWVEKMIRAFDDMDTAAVAGDIRPLWTGPGMEWFPKPLHWMISCTYFERSVRGPVRNGFGANMGFRRSAFEAVGIFREDLGLRPGQWTGGEDTEMFMRIARARLGRVMYEPSVCVDHKIPPTRLVRSALRKRAIAAGRSIVLTKRLLKQSANDQYMTGERNYLGRLLLREVPREIAAWIRTRRLREIRRPIYLILVAFWTGAGYVRESLARSG